MKNSFLLSFLLIMLSACTAYHGNNAALPSRNGIVAGETITVKNGDNVYVIAHQNNVSMRELIVLNELKPPYEIKTGQSLILPATGASFSGDLKPPVPAPRDTVDKMPLAPITPAAVTSQILSAPANSSANQPLQNANTRALAVAAPLSLSPQSSVPPSGVMAAQAVTAQASVTQGSAAQVSVAQSSAATAQVETQAVALAQEPVKALNQATPAQKAIVTTASAATTLAGPPQTAATEAVDSGISLKWPVQGPVLSKFGTKGEGLANDGINIGAPKGAPVVASAPGTVVYAGNEMKGFGNLVLIRHQGDWVTAYAHLDRVLVKKDSIVVQGDEIGTVGKTGSVPSPQLHFEARHNGKPVDPSEYIK